MDRMVKLAHEDPPGLDEHEAWDYVARFACPDTIGAPATWPTASREQLARTLLDAVAYTPIGDRVLALTRMAEALMGTAWVELFCRGQL